MLALIFYKIGAFLARHLPERLSIAITKYLANVQYVMRVRSRRNVLANLELVLGDALTPSERQTIARRAFINFAETIRLFLVMPEMGKEKITNLCDNSRYNEILSKIDTATGIIHVGAHIGPWELGGSYFSSHGPTVHAVTLDHPTAQVTQFFNERREMSGMPTLPLDHSFDAMKNTLNRGEHVAILIDRGYRAGKNPYSFFGIPSYLPNSHLLLAARCGAPICPTVFLFKAGGGFEYIVTGPYYLEENMKRSEALDRLQMKCLTDLEKIIRDHPDQWFRFDRLENPEGELSSQKHS